MYVKFIIGTKLTLKYLLESKYICIHYGVQLKLKTDFITEVYVKNNKV